MKALIKKILVLIGLYDYLRWSKLFKIYIKLRNPESVKQSKREYHFLKKIILTGANEMIFDVGANQGDKTQ